MRIVKCFVMLAVLILASDAFAVHAIDTKDIRKQDMMSFDVSLQGGYLDGESREIVYDPDDGGRTLSELNWDLKDIPMAGAAFSVKVAEKVRFNGGFWLGLSEGSGEMTDYDWMVDGMDWTDYSRGDVNVENALIMDVNVSILLKRAGAISLDVLAGMKVSTYEWEDLGGEYIYSVNSFRDSEGTFQEGEVGIEYEQLFAIPYFGFMGAYHADALDVSVYLLGSFFGVASDEDYHVMRDLHFEEEFVSVPYVGAGITASWTFGGRYYISGGIEYEQIPETTGDMYVEELDGTSEDAAGISHESMMVKAAVGMML